MKFPDVFILIQHCPPIIDSFVDAKCRNLESELSNHFIGSDNVFSPYFKNDVISNVFHINVEHLLPRRSFTFIVSCLRSEFLHACSDLTERIHGAECISITLKSSFKNVELEFSRSRASVARGTGERTSSVLRVTTTHDI